MGNLGREFDVDALPEAQNFAPIPAGWYTLKIAKAEVRQTKAGTGSYINVQYEVLGPAFSGRVIFGMITVTNPNTTAEEIGHQQMGDLMRATGIKKLKDTDQLIGTVCQGKVTIDEGTPQYPDPKNNVRGWKAVEGGSMPKPPKEETTAPSVAKNDPPWAKK